jgi:hypothetical protein
MVAPTDVGWLPLTALLEGGSWGWSSRALLPLNRLNTRLACSFSSVAATSIGLLVEGCGDGEDWSTLYCA